MYASHIWGSMGNHVCQNCSDTAIRSVSCLIDSVPKISDTDIIHDDTDILGCVQKHGTSICFEFRSRSLYFQIVKSDTLATWYTGRGDVYLQVTRTIRRTMV